MNNKALVSVVTIFLNAKEFLQEAIESVFAQTYDNWELLLVDDGSTDGSTAIAYQYAELHSDKVRYLEHDRHQNLGKSTSRNLGISNARGEYITFLDADDVFLPQKLEQQIAILDSQSKAAMVYGPTHYWYSWTENPQDVRRDFKGKLGVQPNMLFNPPTLLALFLKDGGMVPCICSLLVRSSIVAEIGGFDETIQHMYEDQVFLAKICLRAPVFVTCGCWDRYRQHPDSSSYVAMRTGEYHPLWPNVAHLTFLTWLTAYVADQEITDPELHKALHKAPWPYRHPTLYHLVSTPRHLAQPIKRQGKLIVQHTLPASLYRWLISRWPWLGTWQGQRYRPPVGEVDFGSLRRVRPISREFGFDRGLPIDRYYIENFLARYNDDICGRVLEIGDDAYTRRFGDNRVTVRDVLHVAEGNPKATFIGDLTRSDHIPSDAFDCLILTQTLHLIFDVRAALQTIQRILKPGGVVLATFPGISQISQDEWSDYWCWSFTTLSAKRLFAEVFPATHVQVEAFGNVLAAVAFLQGLAVTELSSGDLEYQDRHYELLITVRAIKPKVR